MNIYVSLYLPVLLLHGDEFAIPFRTMNVAGMDANGNMFSHLWGYPVHLVFKLSSIDSVSSSKIHLSSYAAVSRINS